MSHTWPYTPVEELEALLATMPLDHPDHRWLAGHIAGRYEWLERRKRERAARLTWRQLRDAIDALPPDTLDGDAVVAVMEEGERCNVSAYGIALHTPTIGHDEVAILTYGNDF